MDTDTRKEREQLLDPMCSFEEYFSAMKKKSATKQGMLCGMLYHIHEWLMLGMSEVMDNHKLTVHQFAVLMRLRTLGRAESIAQLFGMHPASPASRTGVLKRLEAMGYIRRLVDESNRRQTLVELTPEGAKAVTTAHAELEGKCQDLFADMPDDELEEHLHNTRSILHRCISWGVRQRKLQHIPDEHK